MHLGKLGVVVVHAKEVFDGSESLLAETFIHRRCGGPRRIELPDRVLHRGKHLRTVGGPLLAFFIR